MFAPAVVLSAGPGFGDSNFPLAMGDFDQDGNPDIALAQLDNGQVGIFFGNGDGSFLPVVQYANRLLAAPESILPMKSGGGGQTSILVVDGDSVDVARLQTDRSMRVVASVPIGDRLFGLASVADLNGDGRTDFVVLADEGDAGYGLQVMLSDDDGGWQSTSLLPLCPDNDHFIADFNEDGVPDIVAQQCVGFPSPLHLSLGNGDGTFVDLGVIDTRETNNGEIRFLIGDLNGDGHLDLLFTSGNGYYAPNAGWAVALGQGDGTFATGSPVDLGGSYPYALTDLDGDGHLDYVGFAYNLYGYVGRNAFRVAVGNGDGTFQAWTDLPTDAGVSEVVVGDVNNDGWPDLVASDARGQTVSVFLNNCR
jgi:hypothetical protein